MEANITVPQLFGTLLNSKNIICIFIGLKNSMPTVRKNLKLKYLEQFWQYKIIYLLYLIDTKTVRQTARTTTSTTPLSHLYTGCTLLRDGLCITLVLTQTVVWVWNGRGRYWLLLSVSYWLCIWVATITCW